MIFQTEHIPLDRINYSMDISEYILDYTDDIIYAPFDEMDIKLLHYFGVDPNSIKNYSHRTDNNFSEYLEFEIL